MRVRIGERERRTPLPTILCRHWQATCIGNVAEIVRLR